MIVGNIKMYHELVRVMVVTLAQIKLLFFGKNCSLFEVYFTSDLNLSKIF